MLSNIIEVEKGVFKETRREVAIVERGNQGLDGNEQMATSGPKSKSPPFFFLKILFNEYMMWDLIRGGRYYR